jgi:hypothetical protein
MSETVDEKELRRKIADEIFAVRELRVPSSSLATASHELVLIWCSYTAAAGVALGETSS